MRQYETRCNEKKMRPDEMRHYETKWNETKRDNMRQIKLNNETRRNKTGWK